MDDDEAIHYLIDNVVSRINLATMLFGIIGNLICIFVLVQKSLINRKFNWYLLALASADLKYCMILFANYLLYALSSTDPPQMIYDLSKLTCYLTDYVVNSIDSFCVFLTLILSIDRLYAITNPIKARFFLTYKFPKQITAITYLALLIVKSPELFLSQRDFKMIPVNSTVNQNSTSVYVDYSKAENLTHEPKLGNPELFVCTVYSSHSQLVKNTIHDKILHIYIIYCNIFIPLVLNIIPAIVILILNLTLWFFMKNYTKTISNNQKFINVNASMRLNVNVKRNITKSQKSHYFTIIILGIWLLFTTIPYNTLTTFYWISELRLLVNFKTRLSLTIQGISSAFFNLNHCLNIIIYTAFHKDFRACFISLMIDLFNLNPIFRINKAYLKTKRHSSKVKVTKEKTSGLSNNSNLFPGEKNKTESKILLPNENGAKRERPDQFFVEHIDKLEITNNLNLLSKTSQIEQFDSMSRIKNLRKNSIHSIKANNRLFIRNKKFIFFRLFAKNHLNN